MDTLKVFNRMEDLSNLSKIPVIEEKITNVQSIISEVKTGIDSLNNLKIDFEKTKTDVSWLKGWHNKIVLGVIFSILIGFFTIIFSLVGK